MGAAVSMAMGAASSDGGASPILQYGVSEELSGLIEGLRQASSAVRRGEKYLPQSVNHVSRWLLCRDYQGPTLQLSYLLYAVLHARRERGVGARGGSDLLRFFWFEEATRKDSFLAAMPESWSDGAVTVTTTDELKVELESEAFVVFYKFLEPLSAFLDFLVYVRPTLVEDAAQHLGAATSRREIESFASKLQKWLYDFLKLHMQPVQEQRRLRYLWDWLRNRTLGPDAVDDHLVLEFWADTARGDDGLGFRLYQTVAENWLVFLQARDMVESKRAVRSAMDVDELFSQEDTGSSLGDVLITLDARVGRVEDLARDPKFLTRGQAAELEPLMRSARVLDALPLTAMRQRTIGGVQSQLVQALRDRDDERRRALLSLSPDSALEELSHSLCALREKARAAELSGLQLLLESHAPQGVRLLLESLEPELAERLRSGIDPTTNDAADAVLAAIPAARLQSTELNAFLRSAETALKRNNRQGFREAVAPEDWPRYESGIECLQESQRLITRCISIVEGLATDSGHAPYSEPGASIIVSVLQGLYGDGQ
jgi:hypothetical protein